MPIAIIANGSVDDYEAIYPLVRSCEQVIAVDGGLHHCHQLEIKPSLIVGDFDSVDPALLHQYDGIPRKQYPVEKDESDLELAIHQCLELSDTIILFAIGGRRIDHTISNLFLLGINPEKLEAFHEGELLFALAGKNELTLFRGQTISLLPIFGEATVTTSGLKWNLEESRLHHTFFSQSNVSTHEKVVVDITEGMALCCLHSPDSSVRGSSS